MLSPETLVVGWVVLIVAMLGVKSCQDHEIKLKSLEIGCEEI